MLSGVVTNRYTEGLYAVAQAKGNVKAVSEGLNAIANALRENPQLKALVEHPLIDGSQKLDVIEKVFGQNVDATVYQFLRVLFSKDRSAYVEAVAARFVDLAEAESGRVAVKIESAQPMTDEVRTRLEARLATTLQKQVDAEVEVNSDLLAGYRIRIGNRVLDATIRGAMNQFSQQLLAAGASEEGTR